MYAPNPHKNLALIWYEYIITLQDEINLVWHRKWNISTYFFVASRYSLLAITLTIIVPSTREVSHSHLFSRRMHSSLVY